MKTFKFAGVSTHNQVTRVRTANTLNRVSQLKWYGHTDVKFVELPEPMTKHQIGQHLSATDFATTPEEVAAVRDWCDKYCSSSSACEVLEIEDTVYESTETIAARARNLLSAAIGSRSTESAR